MTEPRTLSCFFVRELFPLYIEGTIDQLRKQQIESHLATCKECRHYYEKLGLARTKLSSLAETKVSPAIVEYLKQEHHFWNDFSQKMGWKRWPATLKWAIELSVVTMILVTTIHYFPWMKLARTVKRMRPKPPVVVITQPPLAESTPVVLPQATPLQVVIGPSGSKTVSTGTVMTAEPPVGPPPKPQAPAVTATPVAPAEQPPQEKVSMAENKTTEDEENAETAGVVPQEGEQKSVGYVWRGNLQVEELTDEVAARVTKTITDLGGTKAGQVELGWHRGKQRYYHFILPEDNYEKLLSVLNQEGIVQLTKERHPRTIKEGHMRIIMTLEESEE